MNAPCEPCAAGPRGIDGHAKLGVAPRAPAYREGVTFECGSCGWQWLRCYEGEGHFSWIHIGEDVPPDPVPQ